MAITGTVLPLLAYIPPFTLAQPSNVWIDGFTNAGVFVLLALGLNLVVGVAGLLDLGYAAFFAIGAYTYAFVASPFGNSILGIDIVASLGTDVGGLLFWPMLLVGALVAATFGILLGAPTLRLRGDYLAIVTLGFGEIVPIVFLNSDAVTNGTNGIGGLLRPSLPGIGSFSAINPWPYYVTMLVLVAVVMMLCYRLVESGSAGPGRRSARTSWPRRPTASTPSPSSCSRSRSARRRRASRACSTPASSSP